MSILIEPIKTKGEFNEFVNLPWKLYQRDPQWIAPLKVELRQRLNPRFSFFKHGIAQHFIARQNREVVGTISASIDHLKSKNEGAFGFYEAIDDTNVAHQLLGAAVAWLKQKNVTKIMGPYSYRLEDPYPGFLAEGFNKSPYFMMAYTKPYYLGQVESFGFRKAMELKTYEVRRESPLPTSLFDQAEKACQIPGLTIRSFNKAKFFEEVTIIG